MFGFFEYYLLQMAVPNLADCCVVSQVLHESHSRMVYFAKQWYNKAMSSETCGRWDEESKKLSKL